MRRARQETKAFLKAGHEVIVITDLKWTSQIHYFDDLKNKPKILSIKPVYLHKPFRKRLLRKVSSELSFAFKLYYALKRITEKESVHLIISYGSTACLAVAPFSKKKNIPSVWVIQDLIREANLPLMPEDKHGTEKFIQLIYNDKKVKDGKIRFILAEKIGQVIIKDDISLEILKKNLGKMLE